ncbi:hypothetical protein EJ06DRAFT_366716 [Trichodelitschia bisporula]|uniref:NACHT domain-containing protein n=1 Tax=Trichodelitschia bisporula TaxID=703511 RepID=A0A6G1I1N7_9PEZI|nr:hypothetical protein EJ06DRAFT_366716 [Trichodelitschia bisporula]
MEDDIAAVAAPLPSYEVAKNLFLAELPPDQKEVFKATTLDNIFSQAKSTFQKRVDENHVLRAQRKLKPLIDCLEGYGQAMDTLSQTSTLILCPIWGSIRVVLHAAQQYEKYYDKIVDMYARIGDNLPRFLVYEHLFRSHNRVLTALTEAYLDIIRFSTEAIKIFQDSKEAGGSALYRPTHFLKRRWAQFDDRFDAYITSFHRHQTQVAEEAKVAHFIEAKKSQELELASRELQKRTVRTDQRRKTLALLSGINYREMHGRVRKLRHEGTGAWLTDDYDFRAWLDEKFSNSYCIFGIPGSGKTVLASAVIDAISPLYLEASTVLAFHYCYYADRATLTPRNLFGNISRQILDRVDLMFPGVEKLTRSAVDSGFPLSTEDTLSVLLDALRYFSKVFLVWDGLDELAAEDQKIVVEAIPKILAASANVKLVILCRREEHYLRLALQSYPSVEITSGDNSADISLYVNSMVETKIAEGELLIESEALKEEVIERLIVGAKDMWVFRLGK